MTTATVTTDQPEPKAEKGPGRAGRAKKRLTGRTASLIALVIALLWTTPTFGLLLSSFRPEGEIKTNGWWNFFTDPAFTFDNYTQVLLSDTSSGRLGSYFFSSLVITIPAVLFPVAFASFAAYALSWIRFKGRDTLFVLIFALQVVPLQMALVPLLQMFQAWFGFEDEQKFIQIWFAHTCFALPFAVFLLHNFMSELPGDVIEAARVDGANHGTIFRKIVLPLVTPALASLTIFQFLWVWNDLLVALVFGNGKETAPMTVRLAELAGSRGEEWQRLTAGAFISIVVPLIVFLALQRYFVRGLLAGSVKG
ncbi:sugar ABC transporter permease [Actinorhabdospora filicis]|uniref:Sugar ABC transporter permease n=1 Tax=Actinorhabdospora filicis TaxID=1785913 RepID=A0A9W6WB52_9ACTN|nr:carbohydrate ABC transporter permease [Actinorhabdospora filicis]GLZ79733.1 sugar ABC transporter permease [Actinorhabdospora filicis]